MCSHQFFQVPSAGENVCLATKGAKVIVGWDSHRGMISGDSEYQGSCDGFGSVGIFHDHEGIVFQLADATYLNHFVIRLYDAYELDTRYTIEVAMELGEWDMLCDYSKHVCRSWQKIWFQPRVLRYIRLKGVWTGNRALIVSYVATYLDKVGVLDFPLDHVFKLMAPKRNIARFDYGAKILDGKYKKGNSLFDEITKMKEHITLSSACLHINISA